MGIPGIVVSAMSVALGTIMEGSSASPINGLGLPTVGLILMLVGAAGVIVPAMVVGLSLHSGSSHHALDRLVTDVRDGRRSAHHEVNAPTQRVSSSATARPPRQIPPARGTSIRRHAYRVARNWRRDHDATLNLHTPRLKLERTIH